MENLIESIRSAIAQDASPEVRATGVSACRAILSALEATPGQPLASAAVVTPSPAAIAQVVAAFRGVPADQLLDIAIGKLRAALPAGTEVPQAQPLKFQMIPRAQLATLNEKTP